MVLKTLFASAIEEEEEEDVYLRKCNIRKTKRQNEKSRKIALQTNEAMSLERVPSPVPLPTIRSGSIGKSPARKEKPYTSPYFPPSTKSRTNSTDDVYPQPSPPPRSPSFGSPVALGRTLALSLSLFSPGGFTITGGAGNSGVSGMNGVYSGRKSQSHNALSSMRSPEYVGITKAHSTDSNGSWGEIVEIGSPHRSPHRSPNRSPNRSPTTDHKHLDNTNTSNTTNTTNTTPGANNKTPLRDEYYHDGEHNAHLRDSNRVKQFLFHRDRNRARKAQLLYPSGTYGNSCEFSPDLDEHRYNNNVNSPESKHKTHGKIGSPGSKNRRSGSFGNSGGSGGSGKHTRKYSDERNIRVDVDTDTRSGSVGNASMLTPNGVRRASFRVDSPTTPYASGGVNGDEHNSPYYRALTLGARNSPIHATHTTSSIPINKDIRSTSISSVGSVGSSADSVASTSPTNTTVPAIAYEDTYVRRRRDSITCDSPTSGNDRSVEIYETLFPALPVGLVKTSSNVHSVVDSITVSGDSTSAVPEIKQYVPEVVVPTVPVYSNEQVCSMFYSAIVHAGLVANDMPTDTTNPTTHQNTNTTTTTSTNTTRFRAWDDADSSDEESTSDNSFCSDSTNTTTNTSVTAIHQQVQKLSEIDATCGSLIQKCEYIYDTIKTKVPYKFDREYVNMIVLPFVVSYTTNTIATKTTSTDASANDSTTLSITELFTHYVQSRLVYQLVQLLQYEDTRFESNRLPVLYVLYKGSNTDSSVSNSECVSGMGCNSTGSVSVRTKIAHAIEHTTSERVLRCKELLHSATVSEMDVNYISKSGYSELVTSGNASTCNTTNHTLLPLTAVATSCDITAIIQSENERSAYKTKDSEVTIIELMKFIISHEISELLMIDSSTSTSGGSGNSDSSRTSILQRTAESRSVLLCIVRAYTNLFRCYTYKLGAHYAGSSDSVEQPVLLEYLMQTLDGILAWAKVLCNTTSDIGMYSVNSSPSRSGKKKLRTPTGTPTTTPTTSKSTNSNTSDSTVSVLEEVCECILHSTYKHWTNKLNYAQDIAYLLQCEVILTIYTPTTSTTNINSNTGLLYSAVFASTNRTDTTAKAVLPPLFTPATTTSTTTTSTTNACIVQKILYKMLARVCSQHVKVATQAMQSLQSPIIMVRYFLPRMTTAMVSYIFGTEVGRITFMSGPGWENCRREECLNLLVDKLRDCRTVYLNFSTQLQISSTQLLDTTLELLQVIEDAE